MAKKPTSSKPSKKAKPAAKKLAAGKAKKAVPAPAKLKQQDEGYQLAKSDAVKYLHSRRQAMFALARRYHLDAEDIEQEGFEILLTCLRDFKPVHTKADGEKITVQFNTFFGSRLEGKALELRNRDPEYQARQAHMADMDDATKAEFRNDPPLLVQHLDQETAMQEQLRGEVSSAKRSGQANVLLKVAHDSFVEKKLNQLIAQERDDKRRAALMHVKVGGVSSFDEIAYHFGVTDSRASQILNELMDAFYIQRLLEDDLKSVMYDWRKLKMQEKRACRLLEEAMLHTTAERAEAIAATFAEDYPQVEKMAESAGQQIQERPVHNGIAASQGAAKSFVDPFTSQEDAKYPLLGLEWRQTKDLRPLEVAFRNPAEEHAEPSHVTTLMNDVDNWPLIVTHEGEIIDGVRRWQAAQKRGKDTLLCLVRQVTNPADARILRVTSNMRQIKPDKMDLYFAISALSELGLSQQKIAASIGTSRPNVIVYAKVKDKATPKLRALFEDGLIQITNASACVDLAAQAQDALADFIRKYGPQWGKGPQFNEAYEAAASGKLEKLSAGQQPAPEPVSPSRPLEAPAISAASAEVGSAVVEALRQRQTGLEEALNDAETWGQQREAVITRQTQELSELKQELDGLKRELQAHDLLKYGDEATIKGLLKEIRAFHALLERLASAAYQLDKAAKQFRGMPLSYKQNSEIQQQLDVIEGTLNALRVEMANKARQS